MSQKIINEELTEKQKKLVDNWVKTNKEQGEDVDPSHHDGLFHRYTNDEKSPRLVIPLTGHEVHFNPDIAKHLHENGGWTIHDYDKGIATRRLQTKKGHVKAEFKSIGSILAETGGNEKTADVVRGGINQTKSLSNIFQNDPSRNNNRKGNGLQIVVSRHPHDIGGMTSGRSWETSCMRLPHGSSKNPALKAGGEHHSYIQSDLSHQTLAAYLTHEGDNTAKAPLARILLKRHTNTDGHDIWRPENKVYGNASGDFSKTVSDFSKKEFPSEPGMKYRKSPDLYNDDDKDSVIESHVKNKDKHNDVFSQYGIEPKISKITKHTHNISGELHSNDGLPSLIIHEGNTVHKMWHQGGELHNESGPAYIKETHDETGKLKNTSKRFYNYGLLHSPKDGKTPSIEDTSYDEHGNVTEVSHEYHKFGYEHNGILSGMSSMYVNHHGMGVVKSVYGEAHTDNDEPSRYSLSLNQNGTKGYETKSWAHHGHVFREMKTEYDENGKPTDHFEAKYDHINKGDIVSHNWSNGKGVVKTSLGDGNTIEHEYESHTHKTSPEEHEIKNTIYRDHTGSIIKAPHANSGDYVMHTDNKNVEKHFDEQGNLHNEHGPAHFEEEKDETGNVTRLKMMRMYHGQYDMAHTSKGDILHHEYDSSSDNGKIIHNNGGGKMIQTEYSGGVDGYKKKNNIHAIAHLDKDGNITKADDGSPSVLTKEGFGFVGHDSSYHSDKENVPAFGKVFKKSKEHVIGKTLSVHDTPMSGRMVSIEPVKGGSSIKSVSSHGTFIHHYDETGKYKGSEITLPETKETVYGDKEGNLVDKDGYGISLSKERSIEKNSPDDFKLISNTEPLHHTTSKIKLPEKVSV